VGGMTIEQVNSVYEAKMKYDDVGEGLARNS
jgi:hypothetical protein